MEENRDKTVREKQNENLKRDAGPGRPPGQKNYATIYREALVKIAEANGKTADDIELQIASKAILNARSGDYRFYKDIMDRLHGTPTFKTDVTSNGETLSSSPTTEVQEIAKLVSAQLKIKKTKNE